MRNNLENRQKSKNLEKVHIWAFSLVLAGYSKNSCALGASQFDKSFSQNVGCHLIFERHRMLALSEILGNRNPAETQEVTEAIFIYEEAETRKMNSLLSNNLHSIWQVAKLRSVQEHLQHLLTPAELERMNVSDVLTQTFNHIKFLRYNPYTQPQWDDCIASYERLVNFFKLSWNGLSNLRLFLYHRLLKDFLPLGKTRGIVIT